MVHIKVCLDHTLFSYTDIAWMNRERFEKITGLFTGEGAIVYTYLLLYQMNGDGKYLEYAKKHCELMEYFWKMIKITICFQKMPVL